MVDRIEPDDGERYTVHHGGGGWISGPSVFNPLAGPVADGEDPDGQDDNRTVGLAVAVLRSFGDLTRDQAASILPLWRGFRTLSTSDMLATVRRFPDRLR